MPGQGPLSIRRAGVLLHPTSLPGAVDGGLIGPDALRFLDWLAEAGFSAWQMLPVGPTGVSGSPYQLRSAFAGNPRLIDTRLLVPGADTGTPAPAWAGREQALDEAWRRFRREPDPALRAGYREFVARERGWLAPWLLYCFCRERYGDQGWWQWPDAIRRREPAALRALLPEARSAGGREAFTQYLFARQWEALAGAARARGITLFGDLPIYVDLDSADAWWHQEQFLLDAAGRPTAVAGVPPDYFSEEGQLWGNPLYDWERMQADGFAWWTARIAHELRRFGLLRVDHFRGLESCWTIPAGAASAREGRWQPVPGEAMLEAVAARLGALPLVAEDLGIITPAVRAMRERLGLPGMLVLQFAFDGSPDNPYLPARHREDAVVYVGTHDNDTLAGWHAGLDAATRARVAAILGVDPSRLPQALLDAACASPAALAMLTLQDLLGLGSEARMNVPGTTEGNWDWRFAWNEVPPGLARRCHELLQRWQRIPGEGGKVPG